MGKEVTNEQLFEFMTMMYKDLTDRMDNMYAELTGRMDGLENALTDRMDSLENSLTGRMDSLEEKTNGGFEELKGEIRKTNIKIDSKIIPKIEALFDGHEQNSEKLDRIEKEVSRHEEIILRRIK